MNLENMRKYSVTTIVGTRPELIRLSQVIPKFDDVFSHRFIHTGQNFSSALKDVFFKDLKIRDPDAQFDIASASLGESWARLFQFCSKEFEIYRPDAVVILGDTNSSLAGILARRLEIPVYHIEAGLRSFDKNVPEEINRRIIDHTADFNMVYTEHARRNLISEGLHPRSIALIGSPMREIFEVNLSSIQSSKVVDSFGLSREKYFLASLHRQENVDNHMRLITLIKNMESLAERFKVPVILSTHPRTKKRLEEFGISTSSDIHIVEPFGFFDYCKLQLDALCVLSDSGSISEEAAILGFRAITLRDSMERPEALEAGSIMMSGVNSRGLEMIAEYILRSNSATSIPDEYKINNTSDRILKFILSTIDQYKFWFGIR